MSTNIPNAQVILQYLPYLIPIIIIQYGLLIYALVDVIRRPRLRYLPKWGWIVVIMIINIIGPLVYLFIGREE